MDVHSGNSTVLLIDDDPTTLYLMYEMLKSEPYRIFAALSFEEALEVCRKHKPALISLDLEMPGVNGFEARRLFKEDEATHDVPVVFVTGSTSSLDEAACLEAGGADFIRKPISETVLRARFRSQVQRARQSEELREMALLDALTGIPNRRAFDIELARRCLLCSRDNSPLGVVLVDIDCFKQYNDHYGHPAGDRTLHTVASLLRRALRGEQDMVARYGGEELACILPGSHAEATAAIAERLRLSIDQAAIRHDYSVVKSNITVSVGTASWVPANESDGEALLAAADQNLYRSKAEGRNRVTSLPPPGPLSATQDVMGKD